MGGRKGKESVCALVGEERRNEGKEKQARPFPIARALFLYLSHLSFALLSLHPIEFNKNPFI
jgi:hypothetical protein